MNIKKKSLWKERGSRLILRSRIKTADINRAIDWYLKGRKSCNSTELILNQKWCFIASCNNSGSTLLQSILGASNQISTMPHEGQRYTTTLERGHRRGYERVWAEFVQDLRLTDTDSLDCVPRLVYDWMKVIEHPLKKAIIEKTTTNAVRMLWLQKAFPNSYFIGLIRNGYAVCEGIKRKGHKSVDRGARHWNLINKLMFQDAKQIKNFLEVRYEDLVHKPLTVLAQIAKLIDLDYDELCSGISGQLTSNIDTNPANKNIQDYNAESIARLNKHEVKIIYTEAKEMLDYFRYEADVT